MITDMKKNLNVEWGVECLSCVVIVREKSTTAVLAFEYAFSIDVFQGSVWAEHIISRVELHLFFYKQLGLDIFYQ